MTGEQSHIRVQTQLGVSVIGFSESRITDELVIQKIGKELLAVVDAQPLPKVAISFTGVEQLSSAALGVLISVNTRVKTKGGKLCLCDIAKPIFEIFKITKLDRLFLTAESVEKACASLA